MKQSIQVSLHFWEEGGQRNLFTIEVCRCLNGGHDRSTEARSIARPGRGEMAGTRQQGPKAGLAKMLPAVRLETRAVMGRSRGVLV